MHYRKTFTLAVVLMLILAAVFCTSACNRSIEGGGENQPPVTGNVIALGTARARAAEAISGNLSSVVTDDVLQYSLTGTLRLTVNENTTIINYYVNVDKRNVDGNDSTDESAMVLDVVMPDSSVEHIYYTNSTLYASNVNGDPIVLKGIRLTPAIDGVIQLVKNKTTFAATTLDSTLSSLNGTATDTHLSFNSKISYFVSTLLQTVSPYFGGTDGSILNNLLNMTTLSTAEINSSTSQFIDVDYSLASGVALATKTSFYGTSTKNNSFRFEADAAVVTTVPYVLEFPDFAEYDEFNFSTIGFGGTMSVDFTATPLEDLTAQFPTINMEMSAFKFDLPFGVNILLENEQLGQALAAYGWINIPKSFFAQHDTDRQISFYYSGSDNKLYADLSNMDMDKICLSLDSDTFRDVFVANEGGINPLDLLATIIADRTISDNRWTFNMGSASLNALLAQLGINNVIDISRASVTLDEVDLNDLTSISNIEANLSVAEGTAVKITCPAVTIGFGKASIPTPVVEDYKLVVGSANESTSRTVSVITAGTVSLPSAYSGNVNDLLEQALARLVNSNVQLTGFNNIINYNVFVEFPLDDADGMLICIEAFSGNSKGIMLSISLKKSAVQLWTANAAGVYSVVHEIAFDDITGNYSIAKLLVPLEQLFDSEGESAMMSFLVANNGLVQIPGLLTNMVAIIFDKQPAMDNNAIQSIVLNITDSLKGIISMTNNVTIRLDPSTVNVYYEEFDVVTTTRISDAFSVYGGASSSIPNLVFSISGDDASFVIDKEISVSSVSVELNQGATGGYIVYEAFGKICRVPAQSIINTVIAEDEAGKPEIYPVLGASSYSDDKFIEVSALGDYESLAAHLAQYRQVKVILSDGSAPVILDMEWNDEANAEVLSKIYASSSETVKYMLSCTIKNNIGGSINHEIELVVKDLGNFSAFRETNLKLEANAAKLRFYSYAGKDPTNASYYPKYYNIESNTYTEEWDAAQCFMLNWDTSSVTRMYQDSSFVPATTSSETSIPVGLTATNVFGYTVKVSLTDLVVKIYPDVIAATGVDFSDYLDLFADGISIVNGVININPLVVTSLQSNMLSNRAVLSCKDGVDSVMQKMYQLKWATGNAGNVAIFSDLTDSEVSITNVGSANCYVRFSFGDNIGKLQTVEYPVNILVRDIKEWSLFPVADIASPSQAHTLDVKDDQDDSLGVDLFDATLPSSIGYLKVNLAADGSTYIQFNGTTMYFHGSISGTTATSEWSLNGANELVSNITIANAAIRTQLIAYYYEFKEIVNYLPFSLSAEKTVYDFLREEELKATYQLGSYSFDLAITYRERPQVSATNKPDHSIVAYTDGNGIERGADFAAIYDNAQKVITFYPYGGIDFTDTNAYPSKIQLDFGVNSETSERITEMYEVTWNIRGLLTALSDIEAFQGVPLGQGVEVYATIECINANGNTFTETFSFRVAILTMIIDIDQVHYIREPDMSRVYQSRDYGTTEYNIIDVTPIYIDNNKIATFDARDSSLYAGYVGVSFMDTTSIVDYQMWLQVASWDLTNIATLFGTSPLNEIASGSPTTITARLGNEYAGYQEVEFETEMSGGYSVSIASFEKDPALVQTGVAPYNKGVDLDGNFYLEFDQYSVDVTNNSNYPRTMKLQVTDSALNTFISAEYSISWDLSSLGSIDYRASSFVVYAYVATEGGSTGIKLPVTVRTAQMNISNLTQEVTTYLIDVYPVSNYSFGGATNGDFNSLFVNSETDKTNIEVKMKEEDGVIWVYYKNNAQTFQFSNGVSHSLFVKFKAEYLPTGEAQPYNVSSTSRSASTRHITEVLVGNSFGGYQYIYRYENGVETVPAVVTVQIAVDYSYISNITEVTYVRHADGTTSFDTLPVTLPKTMNFTFKIAEGLSTFHVKNIAYNSKANGLYFEWLDKDFNRVSELPYYIRIINQQTIPNVLKKDESDPDKDRSVFFTFVTSTIIVEEDISGLFHKVSDGGIIPDDVFNDMQNKIAFMWQEAYRDQHTAANAIGTLLNNTLLSIGINLNNAIVNKYSDAQSIGSAAAFGTYRYVFDETSEEVTSLAKPGNYSMIFTVNEDEPKYRGSSTLPFVVTKKDISGDVQYFKNTISGPQVVPNVSLSSDTYKNDFFTFSAALSTTLSAEKQGFYSDVAVFRTVYNASVGSALTTKYAADNVTIEGQYIKNAGNYTVGFDVYDSEGNLHELYCVKQIIPVSISKLELTGHPSLQFFTISLNPAITTATPATGIINYVEIGFITDANIPTERIDQAALVGNYTLTLQNGTPVNPAVLTPDTEYVLLFTFTGNSNYSNSTAQEVRLTVTAA